MKDKHLGILAMAVYVWVFLILLFQPYFDWIVPMHNRLHEIALEENKLIAEYIEIQKETDILYLEIQDNLEKLKNEL